MVGPYQELISHFFASLYEGKDASIDRERIRPLHWIWILGPGWNLCFHDRSEKFAPIFSLFWSQLFPPVLPRFFFRCCIVYAKILSPISPSRARPSFVINYGHFFMKSRSPIPPCTLLCTYDMWWDNLELLNRCVNNLWLDEYVYSLFFLSWTLSVDPVPTKDFFPRFNLQKLLSERCI